MEEVKCFNFTTKCPSLSNPHWTSSFSKTFREVHFLARMLARNLEQQHTNHHVLNSFSKN